MHNFWARLNAIFFYSLTVMACVSGGSIFTTLFFQHSAQGKVALNEITQFHAVPSRNIEKAVLTFDLDADLTGRFDWNVKQMFVWVAAEYVTRGKLHQVVLWDTIITKETAHIQLENQMPEYPLYDYSADLRGAKLNLTVRYEVMPHVGFILNKGDSLVLTTTPIELPRTYVTKRS
eukprot:TRINITY_DN679_c0_g3_i1.p1 TRINITY_DN679_c0_g3~~TRINITY_DN679_c0_g3_i1.p1  ORF type:complete len:176 (+),score=49.97 TRINITY_DN679_c0_g3_i1:76-603(+)